MFSQFLRKGKWFSRKKLAVPGINSYSKVSHSNYVKTLIQKSRYLVVFCDRE